jgi:hypothetical protein
MAAAFMYLKNVNDTITPSSFDNQNLPIFLGSSIYCAGTDNCTMENGQPAQAWTTDYGSIGCQTATSSYMNPLMEFNVCSNYNNVTYAKLGCFVDSHGHFFATYEDAACTQPKYVQASRSRCSTSITEAHCNAPLTQIPGIPNPLSESPEPSAASSLHCKSLFLLLATIFASFM